MAFLLDDTTLKVENYIIVIEFYKLGLSKIVKPYRLLFFLLRKRKIIQRIALP